MRFGTETLTPLRLPPTASTTRIQGRGLAALVFGGWLVHDERVGAHLPQQVGQLRVHVERGHIPNARPSTARLVDPHLGQPVQYIHELA